MIKKANFQDHTVVLFNQPSLLHSPLLPPSVSFSCHPTSHSSLPAAAAAVGSRQHAVAVASGSKLVAVVADGTFGSAEDNVKW